MGIKSKFMQDELTTAMHSEFMENEISRDDLDILGVYGAMRRGVSKEEALSKYGISENVYDKNIKRVLNSSTL